ncbi:hypothetical protein MICAC_5500003 [Microcystis aeruginosa PCC 9443]|uniref:Uncharacterized protein n=1 Tax=Microcystis aeruginosa PCC 9443 TaxID=1160281 RepID=I4G8H4_MICAE|nr:hypothetical protein MICAC_5500003 [Microcystis aeruginosa PCC 9443]
MEWYHIPVYVETYSLVLYRLGFGPNLPKKSAKLLLKIP